MLRWLGMALAILKKLHEYEYASMVRTAETSVPRRGAGVFRGVQRASGMVKKGVFE